MDNTDQMMQAIHICESIQAELEKGERGEFCCRFYLAEKLSLLMNELNIKNEVFERDAA